MRLKRFETVAKLMQLLEAGCIFFPGCIVIDGKQAGVLTWFLYGACDDGCSRNVHAIGQTQVTQNDGAATYGAMGTNARAARHAHAAGHGGVFANVHVVANLNEVVELDAVFDDRVLQCTAVDAGIGTDFDIVANGDSTQLFNFFPSTLMQCKTKTIGTNHNACMNNAALTNLAILTQGDSGFEMRMRTHLGALLYNTQRTNDGGLVNRGRGINDRTGMNSMRGGWPGFLLPKLRQARKIKVRIVRNNACTPLKRQVLELRCDDDTGRLGLLQMALVFGVTEETQVTRTRCF